MAVSQMGNQYMLGGAGPDWRSLYASPTPAAPAASPVSQNFRTMGGGMGGSTASGVVGAPYMPPSVDPTNFNRLRNLLENPGMIGDDPAYKFIVDQGSKALSRSAGARRMRFAGKTMNEFQDFGQKAASQYWKTLADAYAGGAGADLDLWKAQSVQAENEAEQRNLFMNSPMYRLGQAPDFNSRPQTEIVATGGYPSGRPSSAANYDQWRTARSMHQRFFPG